MGHFPIIISGEIKITSIRMTFRLQKFPEVSLRLIISMKTKNCETKKSEFTAYYLC